MGFAQHSSVNGRLDHLSCQDGNPLVAEGRCDVRPWAREPSPWNTDRMEIGVAYPQNELRGDPTAVRRFGRAVEDLGFDHLLAYDHVLGAVHAGRTPPLVSPPGFWSFRSARRLSWHARQPMSISSPVAGCASV